MLHRSQLAEQFANRLQVDIQTYKAYFRHWRPTPFVCGSAPLDLPLRSVTRVCYESVVGRSILTSERIFQVVRARISSTKSGPFLFNDVLEVTLAGDMSRFVTSSRA